MTCTHKANKTQHLYSKDKNLFRRNIYHVSGFSQTFTEKEFKKYFEVNSNMHPIFVEALKPFGIK